MRTALMATGAGSRRRAAQAVEATTLATLYLVEDAGGTPSGTPFQIPIPVSPSVWRPGQNKRLRVMDGATEIPTQENHHVSNADGDYRLAVLRGYYPNGLSTGATKSLTVELVDNLANPRPAATPITKAELLAWTGGPNGQMECTVTATIATVPYTAKLTEALGGGAWAYANHTYHGTWDEGGLATVFVASTPFWNGATPHATLRCWFVATAYKADPGPVSVANPILNVKVDVITHNGYWDKTGAAITHAWKVAVGNQAATEFSYASVAHKHSTRFVRTVWMNNPGVRAQLINPATYDYSIYKTTKLIPNFDLTASDSFLVDANYGAGPDSGGFTQTPFHTNALQTYQPQGGERGDIGLICEWELLGLVKYDAAGRRNLYGYGDLNGAQPFHLPHSTTGKILDPTDPTWEMAEISSTTDYTRPVTVTLEQPAATIQPDRAHNPGMAYLPYLLSGDLYYLMELQWSAQWCLFGEWPDDASLYPYPQDTNRVAVWRTDRTDAFKRTIWMKSQERAAFWSLRSWMHARICTPDSDPNSILDWPQSHFDIGLETVQDHDWRALLDDTSDVADSYVNSSGVTKVFPGTGFPMTLHAGADASYTTMYNLVPGLKENPLKYDVLTPWQFGYGSIALLNAWELGMLNANGLAYFDRWCRGWNAYWTAGSGAHWWLFPGGYYVPVRWSEDNTVANGQSAYRWSEYYRACVLTQHLFHHETSIYGNPTLTLSATSGTTASPITATFSSAVFQADTQAERDWYVGGYIVCRDAGYSSGWDIQSNGELMQYINPTSNAASNALATSSTAGGVGRITAVLSATECQLVTTPSPARAFNKTAWTEANDAILLPGPHPNWPLTTAQKQALIQDCGVPTTPYDDGHYAIAGYYHQLFRTTMMVCREYGLAEADAAWTELDTLELTNSTRYPTRNFVLAKR